MFRKQDLSSAFFGAIAAILTLLMLAVLMGASGSKGWKRTLFSRLDQIDAQLSQLQADVGALGPQVNGLQTDVSSLVTGGGVGGGDAGPPEVFSLEICLSAGLMGEAGFAGEQELKVEGEGRVGAEAYGNGLMAKIRAIPGAKLEGGVKGEAGGELSACFDLRALAQRIREANPPFPISGSNQEMVLKLDSVDEATLAGKLMEFAALSNLDPTPMQAALDEIPQLAADVDPLRMVEPVNTATRLAQVVPLSFQARARLQDIQATFETFEQHRNLCGANLPTALAGVLDPACQAAASEPLKPLIQNTASRVEDVRSRTAALQSAVASLPSRVVGALCSVLPGC